MEEEDFKVSEDGNTRTDAKGNWGKGSRVSAMIGVFGGSKSSTQDDSTLQAEAGASDKNEESANDTRYRKLSND